MANEIHCNGSSHVNSILDTLEQKDYLKTDLFQRDLGSINDKETVSNKLIEVNHWLSGLCKTRLLKLGEEEAKACFSILKNLKKNISLAIGTIIKLRHRNKYDYVCSICEEVIRVNPMSDTWDVLQNHEHFEKLYINSISRKPFLTSDQRYQQGTTSRDEISPRHRKILNNNIQSVSGAFDYLEETAIEHPDPEMKKTVEFSELMKSRHDSSRSSDNKSTSSVSTNTASSPSHSNGSVNGLVASDCSDSKQLNSSQLNFKVGYFETIEHTLYPEGIVKMCRKTDGLREYTLQKTGPCRVVCLLCVCELKNNRRLKKASLIDHVHGQRHLRNCCSSDLLSALIKYHDTFREQDIYCQAHSIYFMPESLLKLKCVLCNMKLRHDSVRSHIDSKNHKKRVVAAATHSRLSTGPNVYYLNIIDIQLKNYNIVLPVDAPENHNTIPSTTEKNTGTIEKNTNGGTIKKSANPTQASSSSDSQAQRHNPIKSVKNPAGKDLEDLIPNRYKAQLKFFDKVDNLFRCNKCEVRVEPSTLKLKDHIISAQHQLITMSGLPKYQFYCEICNTMFVNEVTWSSHFEKRVERHAAMADSRKERVTEFECPPCRMVIFGDEISIIRHTSEKNKKGRKKETVMPDKVRDVFKSRKFICDQGELLRAEANQVLDEQDPTFLCCQAMEKVLSTMYPDCKAHPFGSRVSGLGNKDSDLDVFLDTGDMYMGMKNQDAKSQVTFVNKCRSVFVKDKLQEFTHIVPIPSARTPIIKLWHHPTDLDCDISFRHGLSVENTKFLKYCIKIQPKLQMLVLLLKKWSQFCGFYEHITTYAFAMLAIFYMQIRNFLPSVVFIRELNPTPSYIIDGWEAFDDTLPPTKLQESIKECQLDLSMLLEDFFSYYMNFNYEKDVVCPLLGKTIHKDLFTPSGKNLPQEMWTYIEKLDKEEDPEIFRSKSELCIQDPFDLTHNLTKACSQWVVKKLKKMCELTFEHLKSLE